MSEPLVAIILVNYNGYSDTVECLKSIKAITYSNYHVIIVENSRDDRIKFKNDIFINQNSDVIYSKENNGFSAGNNLGIKKAIGDGAEYILLLNNDTIVSIDFLNELINTALTCNNVGIVSGNIYYYTDQSKLWYSCGNYDRYSGLTRMVVDENHENVEVNFACGCLALISVPMLKQIGYLDESFFLYSEDTEFSQRAIKFGWQIICNQNSIIYHKISASTRTNSDLQNYYLIRNNLIIIKKYGLNKLYAYFYRFFLEIKSVIRGRVSIKIIFIAYYDFCKNKAGKTTRVFR